MSTSGIAKLEDKLTKRQRELRLLSNPVFQFTELVERKFKGKVWNKGVLEKLKKSITPLVSMYVQDRYDTPLTPYIHVYLRLVGVGMPTEYHGITIHLEVGKGSRKILSVGSGGYPDLHKELKHVETFDLEGTLAAWSDFEEKVRALKSTVPSCIIDSFHRLI